MAAEQRVREPVHPAIPEPLRKLVRAAILAACLDDNGEGGA